MATDNRGRKLPKGIRQRSKDSFEGRFTYQQKTYIVHGETVTKTQKAMIELRYKLEHGIYTEKKKITLNDWFTTWMEEYKKNQVKKGTYTSYQNYYKCAIKEKLGDKLISDIRGEHIQKLYNDLVEEEYTLSSIKVIKAILNSSLKQAVKNGLIERNPVPLATLPRQQEKKDRQAMTKEQQALFMEYAKDSYLYNLFAVMLRTGMRSGEMLGLKYMDIDKKKNVIHVQRTLFYVNGEGYIEDAPKTKTSLRDVPLTAATRELLEDQRKYWGFQVERLDRYLFCNENGDPLSRARIQREIDQITKRITAAGHEFPHITAHD